MTKVTPINWTANALLDYINGRMDGEGRLVDANGRVLQLTRGYDLFEVNEISREHPIFDRMTVIDRNLTWDSAASYLNRCEAGIR